MAKRKPKEEILEQLMSDTQTDTPKRRTKKAVETIAMSTVGSVAEIVDISRKRKRTQLADECSEEVLLDETKGAVEKKTPKKKTNKSAVGFANTPYVVGEECDTNVAIVDSEPEKKSTYRLTLLNDSVDIRYGMLLKYFPKGGVLHLPSGTCETGYYVAANKHITKIYFPRTMETIGYGSFFHCEDLTSLVLSDNITYISAMAFSECKNLCEVVLNSGLKEIGRKAFTGCKALSTITIPKSVTHIGPDAFKDCINLSYVRMPKKTQMSDTAFLNCHLDLQFEYY